ncbi:MAG TPA: hypothetical protein VIM96_04210 [Pseudomonadales bacterium]|jgi:hypothetical protein
MKRIQRALPSRWRQAEAPTTDDGRIFRLMDKLVLEINQLNKNLRSIDGDPSAEQTCREMIRSRERLHQRLRSVSPAYRA